LLVKIIRAPLQLITLSLQAVVEVEETLAAAAVLVVIELQ
jgi:hypothetical protein